MTIGAPLGERAFSAGTANALELRGVSKAFGALSALDDVTMTIGPGEKGRFLAPTARARQRSSTASPEISAKRGSHKVFGEDITRAPAHERIRRGLRRTYQISLLFAGLSVVDNVFLACKGVARGRFSLLRPGRRDTVMESAEELVRTVRLEEASDTKVSDLSYGQQRQLEIAMALSGAPRFILFDEPAAGLSPGERRELVEILRGLPSHMGYIVIEHDMDVALQVSESVTMMHNGRIFKEGKPAEIEEDEEVQALYLGGGHA